MGFQSVSQATFSAILSVGLIAEQFLMAFVDFLVSVYITMKKSFGIRGNHRMVEFNGLNLSEIISAVYLPAPLLQKSYVYCVRGTIERTAHTHKAVMPETQLPVGIPPDILRGAVLHAKVTSRAFVVHPVKE